MKFKKKEILLILFREYKSRYFQALYSEHLLVGEEDDEGGQKRHHRDRVRANVHVEAPDDALGHAARRVVAPLLSLAALAHAGEPPAASCALLGGQL